MPARQLSVHWTLSGDFIDHEISHLSAIPGKYGPHLPKDELMAFGFRTVLSRCMLSLGDLKALRPGNEDPHLLQWPHFSSLPP